jgi:hypothetical protein
VRLRRLLLPLLKQLRLLLLLKLLRGQLLSITTSCCLLQRQ